MHPIEFPGSVEVKKPDSMTDEECFSIWAHLHRDTNGRIEGFTTCWKPSYEDLQALNRGEGIFVYFPWSRLAPMALYTIDENGVPNDYP